MAECKVLAGGPSRRPGALAGHGVVMLLKVYAHCIGGQADAADKRIGEVVAAQGGRNWLIRPEEGSAAADWHSRR
jgi:hypothetical protein